METARAEGLDTLPPERPPEPGQKGRVRQEPATNLLRRFRDFRTEVLRFIDDFQVPFDNNPVERLVRPVQVKLKVAGGFRAVGSSACFCVIRSVWQTHKLQAINPFHILRRAFDGTSDDTPPLAYTAPPDPLA